jgi:hypothetical protein
MTNSTAVPTNTNTRAAQAQERYHERLLASASRFRDWRPLVLALVAGLLIGAGTAYALASQAAPLAGAARITNAEVVTQADGERWFVVSGWAIRLPSPLELSE